MFMHYKQRFPALARLWASYEQYQQQLELPARYLLLEEGKRAKYYYYIHKGAVRAFLNTPAGEDKTVQFFFEGDGLSSFESFMRGVPSAFSVETLEPAVITALPKAKVIALVEELKKAPEFLDMAIFIFSDRQIHYMKEYVSFLRDSPTQRYERLMRERPHILQRVSQHYIASYLGVTAVHLSRIKARIAKNNSHF